MKSKSLVLQTIVIGITHVGYGPNNKQDYCQEVKKSKYMAYTLASQTNVKIRPIMI